MIKVWKDRKIQLVVSQKIIEEIIATFKKPKISKYVTSGEMKIFLKLLWQYDISSQPKLKLTVVKEDSEDNKFIEVAIHAKADYIVSGDKHLLNLKEYNGVKIITAKRLIEILK